MSDYLLITGMSGAGRSTAAAALEDAGWYVIDNMPPSLLTEVAEVVGRRLRPGPGGARDGPGRRPRWRRRSPPWTRCGPGAPGRVIVYLDAPDHVLVRRFEGTRRRHPSAAAGGRGDLRRASAPRAAAGPGRHGARHRRAQREPAAGQRVTDAVRRRPGAGMQHRWCRSGTSTACRSTPTSSSTAASCRTRTGGGPAALLGPRRPGPRLRARPAEDSEPFLDRVDELVGTLLPAFERRGKVLPDHRLGLHGRAAPLGRPGRGARRAVADERRQAHRVPPGHRPVSERRAARRWWPSAAVTGSPPPCAPLGATPVS